MNVKCIFYMACIILLAFKAHCHELDSLHRGELIFMNYCSGCHTLRYMSHPRVSMPTEDAIQWFGKVPPDLSLIARERGTNWLTAYLTGFYSDASRPFGSNNTIIHDVMMPNVLSPLQYVTNAKENTTTYNQAVSDVVVFLNYASDPTIKTRYTIGGIVIVFLCLFLGLIKLLNLL